MTTAKCLHCNGTGDFIGRYGKRVGPCFACKGTGEVEQTQQPGVPAEFLCLMIKKNIRLRLQHAKVTMFQSTGSYHLVAPVFGEGRYGKFDLENNTFIPNKSCPVYILEEVAQVEKLQMEGLKQIGLLTGSCCVCGRLLTDENSVALGIGPICGDKVHAALGIQQQSNLEDV